MFGNGTLVKVRSDVSQQFYFLFGVEQVVIELSRHRAQSSSTPGHRAGGHRAQSLPSSVIIDAWSPSSSVTIEQVVIAELGHCRGARLGAYQGARCRGALLAIGSRRRLHLL